MTIKRHRELEETEGFGRAPKLAKFDYDRFQKALVDALKGKPTKRRLESVRLDVLKQLCEDFGLLGNSSDYNKSDYVSTITSWISQNKTSICRTSNAEPFLSIRLFKRPRDYPTTFLKEIQTPRSPCGGLNIDSLPILFNITGQFEFIDNKTYKPVKMPNHIVARDVVDLLLRDCSYIRVICKEQTSGPC